MKVNFFKQLSIYEGIILIKNLLINKVKKCSSQNQKFKTIYDNYIKIGVGFKRKKSDTLIENILINSIKSSFIIRRNTSDIEVFQQIILDEEFKPLIEILKNKDLINKELNIIDAGANIGLVSIYLSKYLSKPNFFIIEPLENNIKYLEQNLNLNGITNFSLIKGGLYYKDTTMSINNSSEHGNFWATNLIESENKNRNKISVYSIETLLSKYNLDYIDILKIDIEGSEESIFNKTDLKWLEKVKIVTIEVHEEFIEKKNVKAKLASKGFEISEHGELIYGVNTNYYI